MKSVYGVTAVLCLLAATACTKPSDRSVGMGIGDQPKDKFAQNPATLPSAPAEPAKPSLEDPAAAPSEDPQLPGTSKSPAALDITDGGLTSDAAAAREAAKPKRNATKPSPP